MGFSHPLLVSVLFTAPSLLEMKFFHKLFSPSEIRNNRNENNQMSSVHVFKTYTLKITKV